MNKDLPGFYIIGAPKCGTTTLYDWLSSHPLVWAPHKEACFFSQDIFPTSHLATHIPSLMAYCQIFEKKNGEQISGEATPKYLYSDHALAEIAHLRSDARIIVNLRDPVDLVISLHSQKLREGVEREGCFEKAWMRSQDVLAHGDSCLPHEINYYLWACLGSRLEVLYKHFSTSSVLILLASELRDNPRSSYLSVLKFLDLPDDSRTDFTAHNERVRIRNLTLHRSLLSFKKILSPILQPLERLRGGRGLGVLKIANKVNMQSGQYTASVSSEFREEMYLQLADEVALAESYLNGRKLISQLRG